MKRIIKRSFIDTIPIMTGYLVLGFGFGIVLKANGYGIWWALAMSLFIYAGSMQYVTVELLASGASLITVGLTALMVNARHLFYGISMIDKYKNTGKKKPYLIFALTDETYSLVCQDKPDIPERQKANYYFFVSLFDQCYWVLGSVLGALTGTLVKFNYEGIDFALTALFITVFIEQWRRAKKHVPAIIGVASSVACLVIFGKENFLIPAMVIIAASLCLYKDGEENG